jgi:prepilin-type N-terminal cleavage/methylation domain-containing protein
MLVNRGVDRSVRGRSAFTLIELLVVIAIIALLIAILLPSLEAARRQAKQNACLSHIKNIATSSRVYEAEDTSGFGIPIHPLQYHQERGNPTFIGAYEWGGKSGIGRDTWVPTYAGTPLGSKYGTAAGFGPSSRPLNEVMYKGGFVDHGRAVAYEGLPNPTNFNRIGAQGDAQLELDIFKCPADNGPPRGAHCPDWLKNSERSSYDHFGNSYAANVFMIASGLGNDIMKSNSPYLRPTTRVPTPARTLYYEENIGRWAWSCKREREECLWIGEGVDPGPTKTINGWHGKDWTFNRAFVDSHAETQRIYIEGTEDDQGYALHYTNEQLSEYPDGPDCANCRPGDQNCPGFPQEFNDLRCIIVRGKGWQKDTMPAPLICTGLEAPGGGRPSYEDCVSTVPAGGG